MLVMGYIFGKRSRNNLLHVHPDLVLLCARALQISPVDFAIIEGRRSVERSQTLIDSGASSLKDPNFSFHVLDEHGICYAVDVAAWVDGQIRWDWPLYEKIAEAFKQASKELSIDIVWGGDWSSFPDGPHFQLKSKNYEYKT